MATIKYSEFATYGSISFEDNTAAETTTDATPRKIAAFDTDGESNNATVNSADGSILFADDGIFLVVFTFSMYGTVSKKFAIEIYNNAVATGFKVVRAMGTGADEGAAAVSGIIPVTAGEKVTIYQNSVDGGTSLTLTQGHLNVVRIG